MSKETKYMSLDEFNKTGRISHTVASIKRGMDSEKVHKIEGKTKLEIAKMKGKTAFVTMMTQTYAQSDWEQTAECGDLTVYEQGNTTQQSGVYSDACASIQNQSLASNIAIDLQSIP